MAAVTNLMAQAAEYAELRSVRYDPLIIQRLTNACHDVPFHKLPAHHLFFIKNVRDLSPSLLRFLDVFELIIHYRV